MSSLTLSSRRDGDRCVVSLVGDLDLATVPTLRSTAMAELDAPECATLVLDFERVTFLDSTGLGCCVDLRNRAEDAGKGLQLTSMPHAARRTVTIAGLAPIFGLD